jgi:phosphinothricin acetyltransferase
MIRLASTDDAGIFAEIYRPAVADSAISFELDPPKVDEMARRITASRAFAPWLTYEDDGRVVGYAYATRHRDRAAYQWSVDVSVYVDRRDHRKGVGRALYRSLFALLRLQGFYCAHAGITLPNAPSVGLHESMGFTPIGVYRNVGYKNGAWRDVGWWQLPLRAFDPAPAPPRSFVELRGDPAWEQAFESRGER